MASPVRSWLYNLLVSDPGLSAVIGGRVLQQGSILSAQQIKPYLVYHFAHKVDEGMVDDVSGAAPSRQYVEIYIHVAQGDYGPIDDIADLIFTAMKSKAGAPANLIRAQYLETSQDLPDPLLQTFFRYMRYQLIQSR